MRNFAGEIGQLNPNERDIVVAWLLKNGEEFFVEHDKSTPVLRYRVRVSGECVQLVQSALDRARADYSVSVTFVVGVRKEHYHASAPGGWQLDASDRVQVPRGCPGGGNPSERFMHALGVVCAGFSADLRGNTVLEFRRKREEDATPPPASPQPMPPPAYPQAVTPQAARPLSGGDMVNQLAFLIERSLRYWSTADKKEVSPAKGAVLDILAALGGGPGPGEPWMAPMQVVSTTGIVVDLQALVRKVAAYEEPDIEKMDEALSAFLRMRPILIRHEGESEALFLGVPRLQVWEIRALETWGGLVESHVPCISAEAVEAEILKHMGCSSADEVEITNDDILAYALENANFVTDLRTHKPLAESLARLDRA